MKLADIADLTRKVEQGAWVDVPGLNGVAVRVRGMFNSDYNRLLNKLRVDMPGEAMRDEETQDRIEGTLLHETILLDFAGIEDASYSRETAHMLLTDPEYAVFRRGVVYAASVVARDGRATLEADAKN